MPKRDKILNRTLIVFKNDMDVVRSVLAERDASYTLSSDGCIFMIHHCDVHSSLLVTPICEKELVRAVEVRTSDGDDRGGIQSSEVKLILAAGTVQKKLKELGYKVVGHRSDVI